MTNPVTLTDLETALDNAAWQLAQAEADTLPPYLEDDELTVERFWERNKDKMSKQDAGEILNRLAADGKLEKQERRRKGHGGSHTFVYVVKP